MSLTGLVVFTILRWAPSGFMGTKQIICSSINGFMASMSPPPVNAALRKKYMPVNNIKQKLRLIISSVRDCFLNKK